ncbi:hypothetical protein GQ53DRAFT_755427 [Thozetella sp. PMI_491]|nr:hypothetical protein GQ53DRAFT_755427 [Thozetella sp. PMI_491]
MVTTRSVSSAVPSWDPAGKARLIAHMNKDHSHDLSHILQHLNRLSATEAAEAQMLDIDPSSITVMTRSGEHVVVLDPPLEWNDRRQRLIDLTMDARRALGVPTDDGEHGAAATPTAKGGDVVVVQKYLPPVSWQWVVLFGVLFYYANYAVLRAGLIAPGTFLWQLIDATPFPGGAKGYCWVVETIFVLVLAIHVGESWWLDNSRLSKHGVKRGSALWWMWITSCFFEGGATFLRFDQELERVRAQAKGRK